MVYQAARALSHTGQLDTFCRRGDGEISEGRLREVRLFAVGHRAGDGGGRRDQPCAANCSILFCSFTLRTFAIVPAVMPSREHAAEIYRRLKVGNLESVKRDHFRPEVVPFQRPLTAWIV